jgi:hypothetical protein
MKFRFGNRRNLASSDAAAVLDAGWQAMQSADPRLAAAVQKMPPQIAQQAILQYTNAIRMGKDKEAFSMAADAARQGFSSQQQQQAQQSGLQQRFRASAMGQEQSPYDLKAFESDLAAQQQPAPQASKAGLGSFRNALGQQLDQAPGLPPPEKALQNVREKGVAYDGPQEVIFPWDKPAQKNLTIPEGWRPIQTGEL